MKKFNEKLVDRINQFSLRDGSLGTQKQFHFEQGAIWSYNTIMEDLNPLVQYLLAGVNDKEFLTEPFKTAYKNYFKRNK